MKYINKGFFALITLIAGSAPLMQAAVAEPNFELWNKHNDPIYYSLSRSPEEASRKPFEELRAGKWKELTMDLSKPTIIAIKVGSKPTAGQRVDTYTIKPNKRMIVRVGLPAEKDKFKETLKDLFGRTSIEADGYIFGPQTGPLLGFRPSEGVLPFTFEDAVNERGITLKNNVTKDDISKGSMIYQPK